LWVYDAVKPDLWLASISGGTDIASGFVACAPSLPVTAGEIQCRELGVAAYAFNEAGEPVVNEVGELVVTQPMPSMPLFFWNDTDGRRYRESYFENWPGIWRHGDWIRFTERGTAVIYGRSDSTINRFGLRMRTAEPHQQEDASAGPRAAARRCTRKGGESGRNGQSRQPRLLRVAGARTESVLMRVPELRERLAAAGAGPGHAYRVLRLWSNALPQ